MDISAHIDMHPKDKVSVIRITNPNKAGFLGLMFLGKGLPLTINIDPKLALSLHAQLGAILGDTK